VQQPQVLLLDEPMASLDIQLKGELRSLLRRLNRQGQTIIHVTHEYEEALSLGNGWR
jgi:ABC-type sugar transport system ATPase subunit